MTFFDDFGIKPGDKIDLPRLIDLDEATQRLIDKEAEKLYAVFMLGVAYIDLKRSGHSHRVADNAMRKLRELEPRWFEFGGVWENFKEGEDR